MITKSNKKIFNLDKEKKFIIVNFISIHKHSHVRLNEVRSGDTMRNRMNKYGKSIYSVGIYFAIFIVFLTFIGCSTSVPFTNRKSLHLLSHSTITSISSEYYDALMKKSTLSEDTRKLEVIREVGNKITDAAESFLIEDGLGKRVKNYHWRFLLLENNRISNAFAMPDGTIVIYTGLFRYVKNRGDLAVVLGHEVAHVVAGHTNERMSHGIASGQNNGSLMCSLVRTEGKKAAKYDCGFKRGATTSLMRLQESEADRIGLMLMARAGFDPKSAIHFWEKMGKRSKGRFPGLLSTHPVPASRIIDLKKYMKETQPYLEQLENK